MTLTFITDNSISNNKIHRLDKYFKEVNILNYNNVDYNNKYNQDITFIPYYNKDIPIDKLIDRFNNGSILIKIMKGTMKDTIKFNKLVETINNKQISIHSNYNKDKYFILISSH
jgi:hypothetical protein